MKKDIYLTNSLGGKKEIFKPIDPKKVRMYVCGPTVYDDPHIGNARPLVVFDILFKVLKCKYGNSSVLYARNITDVDDKIIEGAKNKNITINLPTPEKKSSSASLSHQKITVFFFRYLLQKKEDMNALKKTFKMKMLNKSEVKNVGFPKVIDNYLKSHS